MANKLYPLPPISQQIEDFAKEMLFSVTSDASEATDAEGSHADSQKVFFYLLVYLLFFIRVLLTASLYPFF